MSPELSAAIASVFTAIAAFILKLLTDARRNTNSERPPKAEVRVIYITEEALKKLIRTETRRAMRGSYHDDETDT
jgi:hypothetical protein